MKSLFVVGALLLTGTAGVAGVKASLKPTPTTVQPTQLNSASVSGNITEERSVSSKNVVLNKTVLKAKVNKSRVLYLNEVVTFESSQMLANGIKRLNAESSEPIFLLIDSPGGSVLDGTTVISEIESSTAPVYTVCTRLCASMAAMIHSYGTKRFSTDRAILMYHPASAGVQGQVPNMVSQLATITRYMEKMVSNITSRSKVSKEEYNSLVAYELWIDAEDSLDKGLIDGIINLDVPSYENRLSMQESGNNTLNTNEFQLIAPESEMHHWNHSAR